MIRSYLTIWLRSFRKYPLFSLINLSGLSIGITACLFLLSYVLDEWSYDRHHPHHERIVRVAMDVHFGNESREVAVSPAPLAEALASQSPAVEAQASIRPFRTLALTGSWGKMPIERAYFASPGSLSLFGYEWLQGSPASAARTHQGIVLPESVAKDYFGSRIDNLLGRRVTADGEQEYILAGIIRDVPEQGHLRPRALVLANPSEQLTNWGDWNWCNYLRLSPGTSEAQIQEQLGLLFDEHMAPGMAEMGDASLDWVLQPITDIHFRSHRDFELEANTGNERSLSAFLAIGFLILLMAAINYATLSLARTQERSREAGIRKTMGSNAWQLQIQFITEALGFTLLATLLAVVAFGLLMPLFTYFTGKAIAYEQLLQPLYLSGLGSMVVLLSLLAAGYASFFLARIKPLEALKNRTAHLHMGRLPMRRALLILQLGVAMALCAAAFVVSGQLSYMQELDPGFAREGVISLPSTDAGRSQYSPLRTALLQEANIVAVGSTGTLPGEQPPVNTFTVPTAQGPERMILQQIWSDGGYFEALNLSLISGEFLPVYRDSAHTEQGVLINATLAGKMGFEASDAIGQVLRSEEWTGTVIGVIEDFHHQSLHHRIEPLVIRPAHPAHQFLIRYNGSAEEIRKDIASVWQQVLGTPAPGIAFLDQQQQELYAADALQTELVQTFTFLVVLIAALGIIGLASFSTARRSKEIAIRKVQGAERKHLLWLLNREFVLLCGLALAISVPLTYFALNSWLEQYAYRMDLSIVLLVLPGILVSLLCAGIVCLSALKLLRMNPAMQLRDE